MPTLMVRHLSKNTEPVIEHRPHPTREHALANFDADMRADGLMPSEAAPLRRALAANGWFRREHKDGTVTDYLLSEVAPIVGSGMGSLAWAEMLDRLSEIMTDPMPPMDHPERYWWRMELVRLMVGATDQDLLFGLEQICFSADLPREFRDELVGGWLAYTKRRRY